MTGKRFGLVTGCWRLPAQPALPDLEVHVAEGSPRVAGKPFGRFGERPRGTGVSTEPEPARMGAISESVERYTSFVSALCNSQRLRTSYSKIAECAAAPTDFALFSPPQYRSFSMLKPLTNATVVDWCWGSSLTRGCATLVPETLAYPSRSNVPPNHFIAESNSMGVACDVAVSHAILAALCEVLERDALAIAWHGRVPLVRLELQDSLAADLIAGPLATCEHEFSLFQIPSDSPFPVVLALAWNQDLVPHAVTGAACRPDLVEAARKALFEASQVLWRLRGRNLTVPQQVRRFDDHARFFATADGASALRRYVEQVVDTRPLSAVGMGASEPSEDLDRAVTALAQLGLETLTVELTTLDGAAAGFRVFRVLVPGTLDIAADPRCTRLGGRRLYELPVRLGARERPLQADEINLLPVPLA